MMDPDGRVSRILATYAEMPRSLNLSSEFQAKAFRASILKVTLNPDLGPWVWTGSNRTKQRMTLDSGSKHVTSVLMWVSYISP